MVDAAARRWCDGQLVGELLGLAPISQVLVHLALPVLLLREPDKLEPVGALGWDNFFSVNHQGRPCRCLSIVLDRFQHRYHL